MKTIARTIALILTAASVTAHAHDFTQAPVTSRPADAQDFSCKQETGAIFNLNPRFKVTLYPSLESATFAGKTLTLVPNYTDVYRDKETKIYWIRQFGDMRIYVQQYPQHQGAITQLSVFERAYSCERE